MNPQKAFLFDLNGTMIDDMEFHNSAWYHILNEDLGASMSREEVKAQMYGKNTELLVRVFGADRFTPEEMERISVEKEKRYQREFFPHLRLIDGLSAFIRQAHDHNILMAIGSAAIPFNIDFVLDNLHLRSYFKAIISAADVQHSKPDPETFLKAAALLNVEPASCIVFEDVPKGVESAYNAGMSCVVLTTTHQEEEFLQYPNILHFIRDFTDPFCDSLLNTGTPYQVTAIG